MARSWTVVVMVGLAPCHWIRVISLSIPFIQKPACGANDTKLAVLDQSYRNLLQIGAHYALVEIARSKRTRQQEWLDLRQDAAGQVDPAARAVQQHQIADEAAKQAAEHLQCFHRSGIAAGQ